MVRKAAFFKETKKYPIPSKVIYSEAFYKKIRSTVFLLEGNGALTIFYPEYKKAWNDIILWGEIECICVHGCPSVF